MGTVVDLAAWRARRDRPFRPSPEDGKALRHWRCFEAGVSQVQAAAAAGVTLREWRRAELAERGSPYIARGAWARILAYVARCGGELE